MPWRGAPIVAVIPTLHRPELLQRCVDSLRERVDELVIIEGVSPTHEARNRGIDRCPNNAIILSIDDDCYYDDSLRLEASLPFLTSAVGLVQLARKPSDATWIQPPDPGAVWAHPFHWTAGGFLFRKSVWAEAGGFPDDIQDDIAFSMVLYMAGYLNLSSTLSWGFHDAGQHGGGQRDSPRLGASDIGRWGLSGAEYVAACGKRAMRTDFISPLAHRLHEEARRKKFGNLQLVFEG